MFRDLKNRKNNKCPILHGDQVLEKFEESIKSNFFLIPKEQDLNIEYYI